MGSSSVRSSGGGAGCERGSRSRRRCLYNPGGSSGANVAKVRFDGDDDDKSSSSRTRSFCGSSRASRREGEMRKKLAHGALRHYKLSVN